jgi:hypothetical protein
VVACIGAGAAVSGAAAVINDQLRNKCFAFVLL